MCVQCTIPRVGGLCLDMAICHVSALYNVKDVSIGAQSSMMCVPVSDTQ